MTTRSYSLRGIQSLAVLTSAALLALTVVPARAETIPRDTVLRATLDQTLSSKENREGDKFTATINNENDGAGLPEGSKVMGVVTDVTRATSREPGALGVEFRGVRLPDGRSVTMDGSLMSLDQSSVTRDANGRLRAKKKSQTLKFVGIGAAGGAVIAALTKGSTLRGAIIGALGGLAYDQLVAKKKAGGQEVAVKSGTDVGVRLERRLAWNEGTNDNNSGRYGGRVNRGDNTNDNGGTYDNSNDSSSANGSFNPSGNIRVMVDNQPVRLTGTQPQMVNGRVLVPIRGVVERLGADRIEWRPETRGVNITRGSQDIHLTVGSRVAHVGGQAVTLDVPPMIMNGSTMVPLRFVSENLGSEIGWDGPSRTVSLTTGGGRSSSGDRSDSRFGGRVSRSDEGPVIERIGPASGARTVGVRPAVSAHFRPNGDSTVDTDRVQLLVNGRDVTANAIVSRTSIAYDPVQALPRGANEAELHVLDDQGRESVRRWTFYVP